MEVRWTAYLLECADGTLYAGYTNDLAKRLLAHNEGTSGAKYTKARRPVRVFHTESFATRSEAMKREAAFKRLSRAEKLALNASSGASRTR